MRVDPNGRPTVFPLLPPDEADWVNETGADVIVPIPGPGTDVLGVLVVSRRLDGRLVRSVDLPFLEGARRGRRVGAGAPAAARRAGHRVGGAPPAEECPVCRCLTEAASRPHAPAGAGLRRHGGPEASRRQVPPDAAPGGRGDGRGLPGARPAAGARRGHQDPDGAVPRPPDGAETGSLGHVDGDASGRGADPRRRVLAGPPLSGRRVPGRRHAGGSAAGGAARARAGGVCRRPAGPTPWRPCTRRDSCTGTSKPSNIGFTSEGSPKLLDFGMAHAVDDAAMVGRHPALPLAEVLAGRPAEEADDVWSLCVVLYEMMSGRHPFAGGDLEEVQSRIRRQRLADGGPAASAAPTSATAVAAFAASILTATRARRPGTAPAFAAALAEVPGNA